MVDLSEDSELAADEREPFADALRRLPCPSIARVSGGVSETARVFDAVVHNDEELKQVAAGVQASPLAAVALVQLLRASERRSVLDGLVAESLVYSTLQAGPEFQRWLASRPEPKRRPESFGSAVSVELDGQCLQLTLRRPDKRNAFSSEMRDGLSEGLQLAVSDPSIREICVRGEGSAFCSGGDLDELGSCPDPATAHVIRTTRSPARLLHACADRVRCEVQGACIGAGIELPAFAERVVARDDAFFQLPELRFGLVPGAGGTVSLPRRIGRQRTALLALSGARIDVERALGWGLIDELG